jgi:hypothetical protein
MAKPLSTIVVADNHEGQCGGMKANAAKVKVVAVKVSVAQEKAKEGKCGEGKCVVLKK